MQSLDNKQFLHDAQYLSKQWQPFNIKEKKSLVEAISKSIVAGKEDIEISLAYIPTLAPKGAPLPQTMVLCHKPPGIRYPNLPGRSLGCRPLICFAVISSATNRPVAGARLNPIIACPVATVREDVFPKRPIYGMPSGVHGR